MTEAEVNTTNPCYGPLMSPPIFQNKWLAKFRALIHEVTEDYMSPITDIEDFCDITAKQWMFVQEFFVQARELSLRQADFPAEPIPDESSTPSNWTFAMTEDFVPKMNPFNGAQKVLCFLDRYLERLQSMKLGHSLAGCRWQ
ncbi:hypothetical protein M409DRAFT_60136 [Zasmidium cellare ATCC 36951]|uniref:Uncharacterized protein n=1 Tax=Zasmidium cellare ATCC 36951 TaxID=1080233 RepID=A0A6A6C1R5_ZASCE|nr:uncharacterized protein M409DRAFT_60136 [Zasmidium cellare ATCC 36951]KAF2160218.1 hypothetical protein M409DRAFT_60136 [Zasmidium cellare ATCC 36951]